MQKINFFVEFFALCSKYGFCIESDDPFIGINIVDFNEEQKSWYCNILYDMCHSKIDV